MVNRVCRNCPIPGCGAKYLVKLSNHLADVHALDCQERRKWLQEARLQPKVKIMTYEDSDHSKISQPCFTTHRCSQQQQENDHLYQQSLSREPHEQSKKVRNSREEHQTLKPSKNFIKRKCYTSRETKCISKRAWLPF